MNPRKIRKGGLLYGEGSTEYNFLNFLLKTNKFRVLENDWFIDTDHASGSSCDIILDKCIVRATNDRQYHAILCFIDTDNLYRQFPKNHQKKRKELEDKASLHNIEIIWQETNHEEVIAVASDGKITGTGSRAQWERHKDRLLRSDFVKEIFKRFYNP